MTAWQWANVLEDGLRPEQLPELITFLRREKNIASAHQWFYTAVMTVVSDPHLTWASARHQLGAALGEVLRQEEHYRMKDVASWP